MNNANSSISLHREGASTATAFLRRLVEKAIGDRDESPQPTELMRQATEGGNIDDQDLENNVGQKLIIENRLVNVRPLRSLDASRTSLLSGLNQVYLLNVGLFIQFSFRLKIASFLNGHFY